MLFCFCMVLTQIVRTHRTNNRTCQHLCRHLAVAQDHMKQRLQHVEGPLLDNMQTPHHQNLHNSESADG